MYNLTRLRTIANGASKNASGAGYGKKKIVVVKIRTGTP